MTIKSFLVRNVLQTYDRQQGTANRLARMNNVLKHAGMQDTVTISKDAQRRRMVERVAQEIIDNFLVSGTKNQVVKDIRSQLESELGETFAFYSSEGGKLTILRKGKNGTEELPTREREEVLARLWEIALNRVDETMI